MHDLARIVFIGKGIAIEIGFTVIDVTQIEAHRRVKTDCTQQILEIAETVYQQGVVETGESKRVILELTSLRDHKQLAECIGGELSQLIGSGQRPLKKRESSIQWARNQTSWFIAVLGAVATGNRFMEAGGCSQLIVQPALGTQSGYRFNLIVGSTKGRQVEYESGRF